MKRLGLYGLLVFLSASAAGAATLSLVFNHSFAGEPLVMGSKQYATAAGERVTFDRLSYLLSGFALERNDGTWLELSSPPAWNDVSRGRAKVNLENIPQGTYRSIRFSVGLPEADNIREVVDYPADHPLNPNLNGLHWTWQTGYIFLALEGHFGTDQGFSYHLARSPNRTMVNLAIDLPDVANKILIIDFDAETLLNAPHNLSFVRDGRSTHSRKNDPIVEKLRANLAHAMRVRQVVDLSPMALTRKKKPALFLPAKRTEVSLYYNRRLPLPALPEDNPLFEERIALGRALFHEPRLSANNEISCASCHDAEHALTDPRRYSVGVGDQVGVRNAMPLFNLAWKSHFFWDGRAPSLRAQALIPIEDPTEMAESLTNVVQKLKADPAYARQFAAAFDPPDPTAEKIGLAIEQFMLSKVSYRSRYDLAIQGDASLSPEEQRGFKLFVTEFEPRSGQFGADCFHCHGGTLFTDHQFHNNGLKPGEDLGRFAVTGKAQDRHRFVTPSLRNIALTAPYMHDGRFATLEEVIDHYDHGLHRSPTLDPNLAKHPPEGLQLSDVDKAALVAFLKTLTDKSFARE